MSQRCEGGISDLESLNSECDELQSIRTVYNGFTSPIQRLPNELLALIFDHCCETNDIGPWLCPNLSALMISKVCSRWRNLAIALPRLWSKINVRLEGPPTMGHKKETQLANLFRFFLQRSQEHPLDLHIDEYRWYDGNGYEQHPAMELAVTNAHRWKNIRIVVTNLEPPSLFESRMFDSLPSLPCLESAMFSQWSMRSQWVVDMFSLNYAPKLTELTLGGRGFRLDDSGAHVPWQQLTSLSLPACSPSILGHCSSLINLHIYFNLDEDDGEIPSSPGSLVQLPRLRSMSLTSDGACSSLPILSSIAVPLLHELEIADFDSQSEDTWLTTDIQTVLVQSECSLSKLSLKNCAISEVGLITFLRHLPSLRELVIEEKFRPRGSDLTISNLLSSSLHALDGSVEHSFLPNLSRLTLLMDRTDSAKRALDDVLLVNAILSRWVPESSHTNAPGIACLREVALAFFGAEFDCEPYKRLRELDGAGPKLELYHGSSYLRLRELLVD